MNIEEHIQLDKKSWKLEDIDNTMDIMYKVITKQKTISEVLSYDPYFIFPFDPIEIPLKEDIGDMERHYVEREEYEACIILRDYFKPKQR